MTIVFEERASDSPFIESVVHGRTIQAAATIRPAEAHWHMVFLRVNGAAQALMVGPLQAAGVASWGEGAELLWIKLKLGVYMPHLPPRDLLDRETTMPQGAGETFWLNSQVWQIPTFENAEILISRLARRDVLTIDQVVSSVLDRCEPDDGRTGGMPARGDIPPRTVRHRFLHAAGLSQAHLRQFGRAHEAAALLQQGTPILDVVFHLGYYDQPHLTRALKRFIGRTPAELLARQQA